MLEQGYLEAQQKKRERAKAIATRPTSRLWKSAARLTLAVAAVTL